jgi:hypothetical protein
MAAMAKKKEEWLAKLKGITTTDQNIDTPSTLTSNSTAKIVIPTNDAILTMTSIPTATTQPPTDDATSITKEESKRVADEQSTLT